MTFKDFIYEQPFSKLRADFTAKSEFAELIGPKFSKFTPKLKRPLRPAQDEAQGTAYGTE